MTNITQRDAFWSKVYEYAKKDCNIIVVSADMGAPSLDKIRRELPSQFINVGIAEQNAITVASGLTLTGKRVFTYAISPFITIRCLEQIRVENAMMKIPITIVGVGVGFGYEDSGPTHHLIEDIAMLRCLPNIKIHTMTDSIMASAFPQICLQSDVTNYIRIYRQLLPMIYKPDEDFTTGLKVLKKHNDYYIVTCGSMTHVALQIAKQISVGVIDVYTLPINEEIFLTTIKKVKKIVTLEENFLPGGLGSAVLEVLNDNEIYIPVKRIGLPLEKGYCYKYGGIDIIRDYYGLSNTTVKEEVQNFIRK